MRRERERRTGEQALQGSGARAKVCPGVLVLPLKFSFPLSYSFPLSLSPTLFLSLDSLILNLQFEKERESSYLE